MENNNPKNVSGLRMFLYTILDLIKKVNTKAAKILKTQSKKALPNTYSNIIPHHLMGFMTQATMLAQMNFIKIVLSDLTVKKPIMNVLKMTGCIYW